MSSVAKLENFVPNKGVYLKNFYGGVHIDGTLLDLGNRLPGVLKAYKKQRMNGKEIDAPKRPFPSRGFENLNIKTIGWRHSTKWPEKDRYWWKITCSDETVIEKFCWMPDRDRGYPSPYEGSDGPSGYWFTVHYASDDKQADRNIIIEGFSLQLYRVAAPEDDFCFGGYYERGYFTYAENGLIADWFKEMDSNHEARLSGKKSFALTRERMPEDHAYFATEGSSEGSESSKDSERSKSFVVNPIEVDLSGSIPNDVINNNAILSHAVSNQHEAASNQHGGRSCCSFFSSLFRREPRDEGQSHSPGHNIKKG